MAKLALDADTSWTRFDQADWLDFMDRFECGNLIGPRLISPSFCWTLIIRFSCGPHALSDPKSTSMTQINYPISPKPTQIDQVKSQIVMADPLLKILSKTMCNSSPNPLQRVVPYFPS